MLPDRDALPLDIPRAPEQVYAHKGWQGIGDWLGTGKVATFNRKYKSFKEARNYVRSLGLRSAEEWRLFCKGEIPEKGTLPQDIPAGPRDKYLKSGWKGFPDWLGTGQ